MGDAFVCGRATLFDHWLCGMLVRLRLGSERAVWLGGLFCFAGIRVGADNLETCLRECVSEKNAFVPTPMIPTVYWRVSVAIHTVS